MTHDDYTSPGPENVSIAIPIGTLLMSPNNPSDWVTQESYLPDNPSESYLPEIVNVVNAVESILPPDVAKKVDDIKTKALALIDALRANEALNQKKVEFAENHLRHFLNWVFKAHDGKP